MHQSPKPVRKCHACPLNLGDRCAVFPDPHQRWKAGKCKGFKNDRLYQKYVEDQARHPADPRKVSRRQRARQAKAEPHHDGTLAHKTPFIDGR